MDSMDIRLLLESSEWAADEEKKLALIVGEKQKEFKENLREAMDKLKLKMENIRNMANNEIETHSVFQSPATIRKRHMVEQSDTVTKIPKEVVDTAIKLPSKRYLDLETPLASKKLVLDDSIALTSTVIKEQEPQTVKKISREDQEDRIKHMLEFGQERLRQKLKNIKAPSKPSTQEENSQEKSSEFVTGRETSFDLRTSTLNISHDVSVSIEQEKSKKESDSFANSRESTISMIAPQDDKTQFDSPIIIAMNEEMITEQMPDFFSDNTPKVSHKQKQEEDHIVTSKPVNKEQKPTNAESFAARTVNLAESRKLQNAHAQNKFLSEAAKKLREEEQRKELFVKKRQEEKERELEALRKKKEEDEERLRKLQRMKEIQKQKEDMPPPLAPPSHPSSHVKKLAATSIQSLAAASSEIDPSQTIVNKHGGEYFLPKVPDSDDYSSDDDFGRSRPKVVVPQWAKSPFLKESLKHQQVVDPEAIFGDVDPKDLELEKLFTKKKHGFRARTSSANWSRDKLTTEEKESYAKFMFKKQEDFNNI